MQLLGFYGRLLNQPYIFPPQPIPFSFAISFHEQAGKVRFLMRAKMHSDPMISKRSGAI
jgi:hypothetical protein